jgi:hypothetical protein
VAFWLARKRREIGLLDACLARSLALPPPCAVAEVIDQKLRLAAALRAEQSLRSWAVTETALPGTQRWRTGAYEFEYGYQRADLDVRGPAIYPGIGMDEVRVQTLYTTSGMSAIAALLTALTQAQDAVALRRSPGGYGETRELLERFRGRVEPVTRAPSSTNASQRLRVDWIDSASRAGLCSQLRHSRAWHADLVVCDTTCWWRTSGRIRRVVAPVLRNGTPVVLVRSHAKLDCLGIEYGRLGSIVVATSRRTRPAWLRALMRELRQAIRLLGVAPIPAHFPPFSAGDVYSELSAARTATIMRSTRRMARRLAATPLREALAPYAHGLYLTVAPQGELRIRDVRRMVDDVSEALASAGLPVRHAGSFGFDFTALEWFPDPVRRHNVIRIAPGDLPEETIDRVADGIAAWFAEQAPRRPSRRLQPRPGIAVLP